MGSPELTGMSKREVKRLLGRPDRRTDTRSHLRQSRRAGVFVVGAESLTQEDHWVYFDTPPGNATQVIFRHGFVSDVRLHQDEQPRRPDRSLTLPKSGLRSVDLVIDWPPDGDVEETIHRRETSEDTVLYFDVLAAAIGCGDDGLAVGEDYFVSSGTSPCGGITHHEEIHNEIENVLDYPRIHVELDLLDDRVQQVVYFVELSDAPMRGQSLSMIKNMFVHVQSVTGERLATHPVDAAGAYATALVPFSLNRAGEDWVVQPAGTISPSGLLGICEKYGLRY